MRSVPGFIDQALTARARTFITVIRTVQELLGHSDVATIMIPIHGVKMGGGAVRSPLDCLPKPNCRKADLGALPQSA